MAKQTRKTYPLFKMQESLLECPKKNPFQPKPPHPRPTQSSPFPSSPNQTRPHQTTPDQTISGQAKPVQPIPYQTRPNRTMNSRELKIKEKYESDGWRILRGGAPDFIALRVDSEGNILEFRGVEVKAQNSELTYEQQIYRKIFDLAKIPFQVEVQK